jgi:cytochrome d ubiquinol oxidase subunit II
MQVMLVVAVLGMPIVLGYTSYIYWKFKGKVRLESASY